MGGIKAQRDCIAAFSETDLTDDPRWIAVPTLVMHGGDDQVVPFGTTGAVSARVVKGAAPRSYPGLPTTHAAQNNADLPAFVEA